MKINPQKRTNLGVGQDTPLASQLASELGCQVGSLPMKYLGLPLGGRIINCLNWNHVVESFHSKLSLWMMRHLSLGGRLTVIKSVLSSIPIYSLLVRLLTARVWNSIHSIMSIFLWERIKDRKKMHLVDWDNVTVACDKEELGVLELGDIDVALLVKWISRYRNKNDRLWKRVACTKSGEDPNSLTLTLNRRSKISTPS